MVKQQQSSWLNNSPYPSSTATTSNIWIAPPPPSTSILLLLRLLLIQLINLLLLLQLAVVFIFYNQQYPRQLAVVFIFYNQQYPQQLAAQLIVDCLNLWTRASFLSLSSSDLPQFIKPQKLPLPPAAGQLLILQSQFHSYYQDIPAIPIPPGFVVSSSQSISDCDIRGSAEEGNGRRFSILCVLLSCQTPSRQYLTSPTPRGILEHPPLWRRPHFPTQRHHPRRITRFRGERSRFPQRIFF